MISIFRKFTVLSCLMLLCLLLSSSVISAQNHNSSAFTYQDVWNRISQGSKNDTPGLKGQGSEIDSLNIAYNATINRLLGLSELYAAKKDYKKAFEAYTEYMSVKDSLFNQEKQYALSNLENDFQSAQKSREIMEKAILLTNQKEMSRQKSILITVILIGGILIFLLYIISYKSYRSKQALYQKVLDNERKGQEIMLLHATVEGQKNERANISRHLQKNIAHNLSLIQFKFARLRQRFPVLHSSSDFNGASHILEDAQLGLSESVFCLSPKDLAENGLLHAVASYINAIKENTQGIAFELVAEGTPVSYTDHFEITVYRIIQELVHNILKHSEAMRARIKLVFDRELLRVEAYDDGKGFTLSSGNEGAGLANIKERVVQLNGHIDMRSVKGTEVCIQLPVR